ncbi:MAG: glycosyltransferase family 2 protein [Thermoanaerobaculia bacterium]
MGETVPAFSLVILCYRSEEYARDFVGRMTDVLEDAGIRDYELVLVANYVEGVADRTPEIAAELAATDPRIRCTAKPKEGWMGWDLRCGLEMARGEIIGMIDGDGQMPASDVPTLYKLLCKEPYDLVKTFRITRGDGLGRRLISNVYNKLFHLLFPGLHARDMNSKPKLLTRDAFSRMELTSDDWFIDAEIMIQARRLKLRIGEIPTGFLGLTGRRSFISLKAVFEFLRNLIRYRVREWSR